MFGNTVTIIGNLTRDPELRHTASGTALASLGVAWNRRYQQNGKDVEDVSYFNITCWGDLGENICKSNLQKGSRVVVVGRLNQNSYETSQGEKRNTVEIVADEVSPSLKWATVEVERNSYGGGGGSHGGDRGYGGSQARGGGYSGGDSQIDNRPSSSESPQIGAGSNTSGGMESEDTRVGSSAEEEPF